MYILLNNQPVNIYHLQLSDITPLTNQKLFELESCGAIRVGGEVHDVNRIFILQDTRFNGIINDFKNKFEFQKRRYAALQQENCFFSEEWNGFMNAPAPYGYIFVVESKSEQASRVIISDIYKTLEEATVARDNLLILINKINSELPKIQI